MTKAAFHDLPPYAFPFAVEWFDVATGEVIRRVDVPGPGVIHVPSNEGRTIGARIIKDGRTLSEARP